MCTILALVFLAGQCSSFSSLRMVSRRGGKQPKASPDGKLYLGFICVESLAPLDPIVPVCQMWRLDYLCD